MAITTKDDKKPAKEPELLVYRYVGYAPLVLVVLDDDTYELRNGEAVQLPKAAEGLDKHPDIVKV
jgi:hypothetical protein